MHIYSRRREEDYSSSPQLSQTNTSPLSVLTEPLCYYSRSQRSQKTLPPQASICSTTLRILILNEGMNLYWVVWWALLLGKPGQGLRAGGDWLRRWRPPVAVLAAAAFPRPGQDVGSLLRQCKRAGNYEEAIQYAEDLEHNSSPLSSSVVTSIIRLYGESGQLGKALAMLKKMGEQNVAPTEHHFGALLQAARRAKQYDMALGLFDLMERKYHIKRNAVVYNIMIATAGEAQKLDLVLELLGRMDLEGVARDAFTYSAAIGACERMGQWQHAISLYLDMLEKTVNTSSSGGSVRPNVVILNNVLNACATGRQWRLALRLLVESRDAGVVPDAISYSSVITACGYAKQPVTAKRIFDSMAESIRDTGAFNAMLTAYERAGEWQEALALFREMGPHTCVPDSRSYTIAMMACGHARQWQECLDLYSKMQRDGVPRDTITYNTMIAALQNAGQWSQARELLQAEADAAPEGDGTAKRKLPELQTAAEIFESAQEVYSQGFLEGKIQHWASPLKNVKSSANSDVEGDGDGGDTAALMVDVQYRYMDLHRFPVSVAKTAIDFVFNEMLQQGRVFDLRIITGRGNHVNSQGTRGVMRGEVEQHIRELEPRGLLRVESVDGNDGCIVVKRDSIQAWLDHK